MIIKENEQQLLPEKDQVVFGKNVYIPYNNKNNRLNGNVLIVGSSGTGKTTTIISPNIEQKYGSIILLDPKGNLRKKYALELTESGIDVKWLNFVDPEHSMHYDPLIYIRKTMDIVKVAHIIIASGDVKFGGNDPYWENSAEILLCSLISYVIENKGEILNKNGGSAKNFDGVISMIKYATMYATPTSTYLDKIMQEFSITHPDSWAVEQYNSIRVRAEKTWSCIVSCLTAKMRAISSKEIRNILDRDDINVKSVGEKQTVIFVTVSDTDRSLDPLANLFFSQAMNELCSYADLKCENESLPVPVQFILDDFATNCKIEEMPKLIASVRSRNISIMMALQAEPQLIDAYGENGKTIIANCDTYVYLGTNDMDTMDAVARRCDVQRKRIIEMPPGKCIIFQRGAEAIYTDTFDIKDDVYLKERKKVENKLSQMMEMPEEPISQKKKTPKNKKEKSDSKVISPSDEIAMPIDLDEITFH